MTHIATTRMNRRSFLKAGAAVTGGLVVSLTLPLGTRPADAGTATADAARFSPNAFIRIDHQGIATLVMPMVEMGQGVYQGQAMLIAEELEIGLDQVRLEHAPADPAYINPLIGGQITGGSTTIRAMWLPLRQAGAVARTLLVQAAAARWGVDAAGCTARDGRVHDAAGGRSFGYGALVDDAARLPLPDAAAVALKDPADFRLIGRPLHRLDTADKVNGRAQFGIDARLPGMKIAAIAIAPVFGGRPAGLDEAAAKAVRGVHQVVTTDEAVAVIADHWWAAHKGLEAAAIRWDDGDHGSVGMADLRADLDAASRRPGAIARDEGGVDAALAGAAQRLEAVYELPFLAHAALEPMNCTVHVHDGACDIWVGTQIPGIARAVAAGILGIPAEKVVIHNHLIGGGFGRRLEADGIAHAVKIARQVSGPVKLVWSREEDIRHDVYRPYYYDRLQAGLDAEGRPVAWTHRVSGSSIMARFAPAAVVNGVDPDGVEGAAEPPYAFPAIRVEFQRVEPRHVPTGWWRGVGPTHNVFVVESFVDELAAAAGADPVAWRRSLLDANPRARAVLDRAAAASGWGGALPAGHGRGVALQYAFGSYLAMVAEVEVAADGGVRVHRLVVAVDCGRAVNPDQIRAQMEGGAIFGLTAALHGEITITDGRVVQGNFDTCLPMRIDEVPVVETHLIDSSEAPGGIGETATAAVSPAVTNAIFAATGKRLRRLPIDPAALKRV